MRWRRRGKLLGLGASLLGLWGAFGTPAVAASTSPQPAAATASKLPFRPLGAVDEYFTASNLTKLYGKDLTRFMRLDPESRADLTRLDRWGQPGEPPLAPVPVPVDSSDIAVADRHDGRNPATLTPEEKDALDPPKPGVHAGIPGTVAATGAMVGGLALLAKILSEFMR